MAYWDEGEQNWVEAPSTVDETNHKVIVKTTHFSPWNLFGLLKDYEVVSSEHFGVLYDKNLNFKCFGTETGNERLCATGISKVAEQAYKIYAATYNLPNHIVIYIEDREESKMSSYTGNILLSSKLETVGSDSTPAKLALADNRVKHEVAHELFHVVQNQYLNVYSMGIRQWWIEASADYAANQLAMHDGTMGMDIKPDYLENSLYAISTEYATSHFIDYLENHLGLSFRYMFDFINTQNAMDGQETLMLLKRANDGKGGLAFQDMYRGFAAYYLFDPKSPIKVAADFNAETRAQINHLDLTQETATATVPNLSPYSSKLVVVTADTDAGQTRTISVGPHEDLAPPDAPGAVSDTAGIVIEGFKGKNNERLSVMPLSKTTWTKAKKITVDLGPDDALYLLVIDTHNTTGTKSFDLDITATLSTKTKTVSIDMSKNGDLGGNNPLKITGTGSVKGPSEMVVVAQKDANLLRLDIVNVKSATMPITISGDLTAGAQKNHWVDESVMNGCTVTRDASNFRYKITYNAPVKDEVIQQGGSLNLTVTQETLTKGEFRADVDLIWDFANTYECPEDSQTPSRTDKGIAPGTNILRVSIQTPSGGWGL